MESNSLLLGRIPSNSGGIGKTYPESVIIFIDHYDSKLIKSALGNGYKKENLYINKKSGDLVLESDRSDDCQYSLVEILNILPYGGTSERGSRYFDFFVEVIEKDILYRHLQDERAIIEDIRSIGTTLSLK